MKLIDSLDDADYADDDERIGCEIVKEAIQYPVKQIANNAGYKGDRVVEKVKESDDFNAGFNAATGEFTDLVEAGIIDPAKVLRIALQNSVSAAAMVLTTDCVITDHADDDDDDDSK